MSRQTLAQICALLFVVLAACTQNTVDEQPTLEEVKADNAPMINLFGTDSSSVAVLVRNIYDSNRNGQFDPGETALSGWGVRVNRIDDAGQTLDAEVQVTPKANGKRWQGLLLNLPVGRYLIEQLAPLTSKNAAVVWSRTHETSFHLSLTANSPVRILEFASVCLENGIPASLPNSDLATWKCQPEFDLRPRIASFTISPTEVQRGERPTLTWKVIDNSSLEVDEGIGPLAALTGSMQVEAFDTVRYTLTAKNAFGSSQAQTIVKIRAKSLSGTFTAAGKVSDPLAAFQGVILDNGKVVIGMYREDPNAPRQARYRGLDMYDPMANTWTTLGKVPGFDSGIAMATALPIGGAKLLFEEYTGASNTWTFKTINFDTGLIAQVNGPRTGPYLISGAIWVSLPNHQFMYFQPCGAYQIKVAVYDANTDTSTVGACLNVPNMRFLGRPFHNVVTLENQQFLLLGGMTPAPDQLVDYRQAWESTTDAYLYSSATQTFQKIQDANLKRMEPTLTMLKDGRVLITGGFAKGKYPFCTVVEQAEIFDPKTGQFALTGSFIHARSNAATFLLPNGKVLFLGGGNHCDNHGPEFAARATPEVYDPSTGQFSETGNFLEPRIDFSAVQLLDGRILVFGGYSKENGQPLSSAEIYNP